MDWILKLIEKHTKDGVLDQEALKEDINKEFPKYAVPKEQYNTLADTKKKLEKDITDRDKQLEGLKEIDAEGLQAEIERLQKENQTAKENYEKELKDLQLSSAIKIALNGKEDGKVVGLDEQINSLRESKGFLFIDEKQDADDEPTPGFQKVGNPQPNNPQAMDDAIAAAFGNLEE